MAVLLQRCHPLAVVKLVGRDTRDTGGGDLRLGQWREETAGDNSVSAAYRARFRIKSQIVSTEQKLIVRARQL